MGAALAQGLALTAPDRVRTLVSAMGLPADAGVLETFRYLRYGVFLKLGRIRSGGTREHDIDNLVRIFRAIASPGYPFPEEWARAAATTSHDRSPRDPTSTQRQVAAGRAERLPSLSRITAPTLVTAGEDDPLVRVRAARETARRIPGAVLATYPGMGHNLPEELWPDVVGRVAALAR